MHTHSAAPPVPHFAMDAETAFFPTHPRAEKRASPEAQVRDIGESRGATVKETSPHPGLDSLAIALTMTF